jgi:hypothetical protein
LIIVISHYDSAWILYLHGDQLRINNRVAEDIILQREDLRAIEIVHVVDRKHQRGAIQVQEFIMINGDVLGAEVRITHRLRVDVNEGTRFHVQVGDPVKCVIPQNEVVKG